MSVVQGSNTVNKIKGMLFFLYNFSPFGDLARVCDHTGVSSCLQLHSISLSVDFEYGIYGIAH